MMSVACVCDADACDPIISILFSSAQDCNTYFLKSQNIYLTSTTDSSADDGFKTSDVVDKFSLFLFLNML